MGDYSTERMEEDGKMDDQTKMKESDRPPSISKQQGVGANVQEAILLPKVKPTVILSPTGAVVPNEQWRAGMMPNSVIAKGQSSSVGALATPRRSSKRTAASCDQSLEKAVNLKAKKKHEDTPAKGKSLPSSFSCFDNVVILNRASKLGASLGNSVE